MDILVEDTSELQAEVQLRIGNEVHSLRGFTVGRTDTGEAFVDWAYWIAPDGSPVVKYFDPPSESPEPDLIPHCRIGQRIVCSGLCTGSCVVAGSDPCDCNATGFCFIDFFVYSCRTVACPGKCKFLTAEDCACILSASPEQEGQDGCN